MSQLKTLLYTDTNQELIWRSSLPVTVTAHMWGGGGGSGWGSAISGVRGGSGSGAGYSRLSFVVNPNDVITVSIGGGGSSAAFYSIGQPGFSNLGGYYGGFGSSSAFAIGNTSSEDGGGGGGGGGATVLLLNSTVVAVAPGGGGGGGGYFPDVLAIRNGQDAPGSQAVALGPLVGPAGGNGINTTPGGNGGGGGGYRGGAAGPPGGGSGLLSTRGFAGAYGQGLGDVVVLPTSINAAENTNPIYVSGYGQGGLGLSGQKLGNPGSPGLMVLEFQMGAGTWVNQNGFKQVNQTYVHHNGVWNPVKTTWIKQSDIWTPILGSASTEFVKTNTLFGGPPQTTATFISVLAIAKAPFLNNNWNTWVQAWPLSNFYLLQVGVSGPWSLSTPPGFTSNRGNGPITVLRDGGDPNLTSDWFDLCNLSALAPGSIVYYSIDNSTNMRKPPAVPQSTALFLRRCNDAGLLAIPVPMIDQDWVLNFLRLNFA